MNSTAHQDFSNYTSPNIQAKIQEGMELELKRFSVAEQFPASKEMADIHYRANMFGLRKSNETRVCPCCLERIKQVQFPFCGSDVQNSFLSSDVVLFFGFIRMIMYYFLLRFVITDAYNIFTSYMGNDCRKMQHCIPSIAQRLAVVNKITHIDELFIVDLLNFAFVGISIIYFSSYDRYLYNWFYNISVSIQTQDDFSVFITNIPIVQKINQRNQMEYLIGIEKYFEGIVKDWLNNPQDNMELYDDYIKVAMNHKHSPQNPPKIITKVNICWDLYQLTNIGQQKQKLQQEFQASKKGKGKKSVIYDDFQTMEDLMTLNRAGVDMCQQFQMNKYYGFVISKFLGKAFVSFEYQHFALLIHQKLADSPPFLNHKLRAIDAAPPRDVYWQNLNVTRWQRIQKLIITFFICFGILIVAFFILFGIKYRQRKYYNDLQDVPFFHIIIISIIVSLITLAINWVIKTIIKSLVNYQQHNTRSDYNVGVIHKTIVSVIFNQVLNPFLVNIFLRNLIWSPHGLISQITYLLLTSLGLQIAKAIIQPKYLWYWIKLKYYTWNSPPLLKFQDNFNQKYALPDFQMHQKYIFFLDELYLISFFAYIVPEGSIIGVIILAVQYCADKYDLVKRSSFHPSYSYKLIQKCLILAESSVLVFAIGNYANSYLYYKKWFQPLNLLAIAVATIYTILIWIDSIRKLCIRSHTVYEKMSYSDCIKQSKFFHTYYSLNPATQLASDNRKNKQYIGVNYPLQNVEQGIYTSRLSGF